MSTAQQRRFISRLRMVAQRLVGEPWPSVTQAAYDMMCLQGQDWPGVQLSLALRTRARSLSEVREAFNSGRLVRTWPQRGTLHVLSAADVAWYLPLTAQRKLAGEEARRQRWGVSAADIDAVRDVTVQALRTMSPRMTREELEALWVEHRLLHDRNHRYYFLHHLCVEGTLVLGPMDESGVHLFVLAEDWIRESRRVDRDDAVVELVSRYLRSHGPASRRDLNWWSGLPLREIDAAIEECAAHLTSFQVDGQRFWVDNAVLERAESTAVARSVLALPGFDELILGYASRYMTVPERFDGILVPGNHGVFRSSIISGATAVGYWRRSAKRLRAEFFAAATPSLERRVEHALARLPR